MGVIRIGSADLRPWTIREELQTRDFRIALFLCGLASNNRLNGPNAGHDFYTSENLGVWDAAAQSSRAITPRRFPEVQLSEGPQFPSLVRQLAVGSNRDDGISHRPKPVRAHDSGVNDDMIEQMRGSAEGTFVSVVGGSPRSSAFQSGTPPADDRILA
jgi:hypothetical protein